MVFANLFFLYIFLPVNLILYYATRSYAVRNFVLVAMSFLFYAWGEPVWVKYIQERILTPPRIL